MIEHAPEFLDATLDRIFRTIRNLGTFPSIGRPSIYEGTRELPALRTPYLIDYEIAGDTVWVTRVRHGAMLWPPGRKPDDE